jgi:hypothetical protein
MKKLWKRLTRKRYEQGMIDAFKYMSECLDAVDDFEKNRATKTSVSAVTHALRLRIKNTAKDIT